MKVIITEQTKQGDLFHTSFAIKEGSQPTQFMPDAGREIVMVTIAGDSYQAPFPDDIKPLP